MEALIEYYQTGGWIMFPLLCVAFALWYMIGYRFAVLRKIEPNPDIRELLTNIQKIEIDKNNILLNAVNSANDILQLAKKLQLKNLRQHLETAIHKYQIEIKRFRGPVFMLVSVAPLLGLLGTVNGMIETFSGLENNELFAQSGGIAGGISQALITTQFGLVIAIPGLFIHSYLNKRQVLLEMKFQQLLDISSSLSPTKGRL